MPKAARGKNSFTNEELAEAERAVTSLVGKLAKVILKLRKGSAQHSLAKNRLKALRICSALLKKEEAVARSSSVPTTPVMKTTAHKEKKLKDGARCKVIAGTHEGKAGIVQDSNVSKTGHVTITVVQANGVRFKTLAKNVEVL